MLQSNFRYIFLVTILSLSMCGCLSISAQTIDSLAVSNTLALTDSLSASDSLKVSDTLAVSDSLALTDSLAVSNILALPDSLAVSNILAPTDSLAVPDSLQVSNALSIPDSLAVLDSLAISDSLAVSDSLLSANALSPEDSVLLLHKSMLDFPAFSTARDSIVEDFSGGKRMIYYYGDVKVKFGNMDMSAEYMAYNIDTKTVYASGIPDTTGVLQGKPEMTESGQTYTMDDVYYNFGTRKAKIRNMITKEEEGFLHGEVLKMMPDKSINISKGKYTVCDLDHPHYYLHMTAAKVISQPSQKTVFGPAYLVLEDVPLPLALPFGFVPKQPQRASGILFPTYGEETSRGFYLKELGYYMVFGDHFDISLTGDIYTLGSWAIRMTSRYKVRYKFDGNFDISYSNDQTGEKGSNDFFQSKNFGIKWSHSQDSKARPGTSFRASVNFSSPSNNKYNNDNNLQQAIESQVSSSISYSKTWSKMSLSLNVLHSQNSRDSSYSITLPNITFNVNRFNPFKRKMRVGKEKFYEQITFSYNTTLQNRINFKASEFGDPDFWSKMKNGMTHKMTIGLPSFTLLNYLNFTPGVNYGMNWYFQKQSRLYNPDTDKVETITGDPLSAFGISQDFSASLSMNTRIYGTFNFKGKGALRALRHMITPSFSASFKPEMGTPMNGYMTYDYVDINGVQKSVDYNQYTGGVYSPPGKGKTASMSFSVGNNLEAKVVDKKDTTGTGLKKIKLIDQLNLSSSYNFLADSMKLANLSVSMNTTLFQKVSLSGNLTLDPYAVDGKGKKYNEYNIVKMGGLHLFRLTNASASLSYSLSGEGKGKGNDGRGDGNSSGGGGSRGGSGGGGRSGVSSQNSDYTKIYYHPVTGEYIPGGWVYYLNPEVPWSVNLSYSYSYSKSYQYANEQLQEKNNHMQTMNVGAQIRLTKAMNISLNSGVDLTKFKITTSQLSATYDLHCFQISVSWIPTGQWESWSFRINAKASALADLLQYKKSSSYWDN